MTHLANQLPIVDCMGCGVCCLHMGYPAFNLPTEILRQVIAEKEIDTHGLGPAAIADLERWIQMPRHLQDEILEAIETYRAPVEGELDQACIWLDPTTRLCSHHTHRPQVCRDFEVGCKQCHDWRLHYRVLIE